MFRKTLNIETKKNKQVVDITDAVKEEVSKSNVKAGNCFLFITHTTAAITCADLDPGTDLDMLDFLEKIKPDIKYRHPHNPAHAPDHILSSVIGSSVVVPVEDGRLVLGTWQRIVLVELDGPRTREVVLTIQ